MDTRQQETAADAVGVVRLMHTPPRVSCLCVRQARMASQHIGPTLSARTHAIPLRSDPGWADVLLQQWMQCHGRRALDTLCSCTFAADQLLAKKSHAELLHPYEQRAASAAAYLTSVRPGLTIQTGALVDPKVWAPRLGDYS